MIRSDQSRLGTIRGVLCALLIALPTATALAGDKPSGEEIMKKYIEATGGEAAYKKFHNRVVTGTIEVPAASIKGTMTINAAAPNHMRLAIDIEGFGKTDRGTNGEIAWESSTIQGARLIEGDELKQFLREADFNAALDWKSHYKKIEVVGEENVGDRPAWKVEQTTDDGKVETVFYDKETGLSLKQIAKFTTPMGEIEATTMLEDYKAFDGIKMPTVIRQTVMGNQQIMKFDTVKHNVDLAKDAFMPPDDVKALKKSDAKPASKPADKP